jgi:hypothetical protein
MKRPVYIHTHTHIYVYVCAFHFEFQIPCISCLVIISNDRNMYQVLMGHINFVVVYGICLSTPLLRLPDGHVTCQ